MSGILTGDCRDILPTLDAGSVHCVVTSPPYWGLRDYGVAGQLGLEPTPEEYVANMVAVFREVRRVLRDDGTVWLNLGDSYSGGTIDRADNDINRRNKNGPEATRHLRKLMDNPAGKQRPVPPGLKPKDLVGIPWRVAFALQADGWYLRSDIIWSKPNPMPESVTDRPTKAHEYVFLLSKRERYYFDADAVRENYTGHANGPSGYVGPVTDKPKTIPVEHNGWRTAGNGAGAGRNIRSVWNIATQPYPGAHFATFPEALVAPCIKAGTSERGVCSECGAPWERVVERETNWLERKASGGTSGNRRRPEDGGVHGNSSHDLGTRSSTTTGWHPTCAHDAPTVPATVLDPFSGSGTVGRVAERLSRRSILIELNPEYVTLAEERTAQIGLAL